MSKVQIIDPNSNQEGEPAQPVSFGGTHAASRGASSQLTTLHEQPNEHITTSGTRLCTAEAMHLAVEEFAEHIDNCNVTFKEQIMNKVKQLKHGDTQLLTERVSVLNATDKLFEGRGTQRSRRQRTE